MLSALDHLTWHRVRLQLKNTRNVHGKEPPLSIFEAVFKCAKTLPDREVDVDFVFHPAGYALPDRINKGQTYPLELIFFRTEIPVVEKFLANLRRHLSDWRNNYSLVSVSAVECRNLSTLKNEHDPLPDGCSEICLDFLTPLPFTPKIVERDTRDWRLFMDRDQFFTILSERVVQGFSLPSGWLPAEAWSDFRVLSYYWEYKEAGHLPKSNRGEKEMINGGQGPLYIKGPVAKIYPLLLLCSEINASSKPAKGRGYYLPRRRRPFFDIRLQGIEPFKKAFADLERESDLEPDPVSAIGGADEMLGELHESILRNRYRPAPFSSFTIPKKSGGSRLIAVAAPRDQVVQRMLHDLLVKTFDRMFEDCSIGFRRGKSRNDAKRIVASAVRQGYTHVFESDVEAFFDSVDWPLLLARLAQVVPEADVLTLGLLELFITADLVVDGRPCPRRQGLIQGMVLAPLLANLYLDTFDEEMTGLGHWLVRYGDDFLVMTRTREEGERARLDAATILQRLKLSLNEKKTAVTALDAGFSFLGFDFGPDLDEDFIDRTALRKTVFLRNLYAMVGIDTDSLIIKKDQVLIARLPINRIGEIVVFGNNTVSTRLLQRCSKDNIPVSFCQAGGRYINTLRPDSMAFFGMIALHTNRFHAISEERKLAVAKKIVTAKLLGYLAWLTKSYGVRAKEIVGLLQERLTALQDADRVESLRGFEGEAASKVYEFVGKVIVKDSFAVEKRQPRAKCDPFNVLLDFASSLVFSRINVLLRSQGLNPYLGFLHSHKDHYESLVCDLQEVFRARTDRFVLKIVNRRIIRPEHFERSDAYGTWSMKTEGVGLFLEAFEREINIRLAEDGGTFKQLLVAQVQVVRQWVTDAEKTLFFFQPRGVTLCNWT